MFITTKNAKNARRQETAKCCKNEVRCSLTTYKRKQHGKAAFMDKAKQKPKSFTVASVVGVTLILALLGYWFQIAVKDVVVNATIREMEKIGAQQEYILENAMEEAEEDLSLLAQYAANAHVTEETAIEFLRSQSQSEEFDNLYYVDLEGNGTSLSGTPYDFSDNASFLSALENEVFITDPHISATTGTFVFDVSAPIIEAGNTTAVLLSEFSINTLLETPGSVTYGTGDVFIVDSNLNFIFSTSENHEGREQIPEGDMTEMGIDNVTNAQNDIINNESGSFYYDYYGVSKVMVYMPISMTNWSLALNVETEAISSELSTAVDQLQTIFLGIYLFLVFLVVYIWLSQRRSVRLLVKTAYYDSLTGLPNMEKLKKDMGHVLTKNKNKPYAIAICDIEKFKVINEMYGYEMGDHVLKSMKGFADRLQEPTLIFSRIGADKFALFSGNHFLDDIDTLISECIAYHDEVIPELIDHNATFKCGRYHIELGETDVDNIINKVTLAHKTAKGTTGQALCDYDDLLKQKMVKDAEITNKMRSSLENEEFEVYLQPKFSVHGSELVGAEALVRWIEPDGSIVFPGDFIPLFEKNGFIVELDRYIFEHVCLIIRRWIDNGNGLVPVSVNLSRLNLHSTTIAEELAAIADQYRIPHHAIEVELTESAAVENEGALEALYAKLHQYGFKTAIDDFGSGYSSLSMLKNLHVDTLKMDRSFFVEGRLLKRDDMLIDGIVKLAHNLGMYVVAEGIETKEQIEMLTTMNCDAVQGYVYARPMPVSEFEDTYRELMKKVARHSQTENTCGIALIYNINDSKFTNSFIPCGILITKADEHFTIVEANEGYFDLIGYTKEEVRDLYKNRGIDTLHPEDKAIALNYFTKEANTGQFSFVCRLVHKQNSYRVVQFGGKISINEQGQKQLYFSLMDITSFAQTTEELQNEKHFNSLIALLTDNVFFDYDFKKNTMRFSRNFANRLNIPDVIENYLDSSIRNEIFFEPPKELPPDVSCPISFDKTERSMKVKLPSGEIVWYLCNYKHFTDASGIKYRTVGKMTDITTHYLEVQNLKEKAETDLLTGVYNRVASEHYIQHYLDDAGKNIQCAFLIIDLDNFKAVNDTLGHLMGDVCLQEVGSSLKQMFRDKDIIGRIGGDEFSVLIKEYKTLELIERKAQEICTAFCKTYEKDGMCVSISASVGIALYPEHGTDFNGLYKKADNALYQMKHTGKNHFTIYKESENDLL